MHLNFLFIFLTAENVRVTARYTESILLDKLFNGYRLTYSRENCLWSENAVNNLIKQNKLKEIPDECLEYVKVMVKILIIDTFFSLRNVKTSTCFFDKNGYLKGILVAGIDFTRLNISQPGLRGYN